MREGGREREREKGGKEVEREVKWESKYEREKRQGWIVERRE